MLKLWRIGIQGLLLVVVVVTIALLWHNLTANLQQQSSQGSQLGFDFLREEAKFNIGEASIPYQPSDSYSRAILVGILNSLKVVAVGIVLATILGVTAGIARLSNNWLLQKLALLYVEVLRNIPLLLQLFFWYFAFFLSFPKVEQRLQLPGAIYLTKSGIWLPWLQGTSATSIWLFCLAIGGAGAGFIFYQERNTLRPLRTALQAGAALVTSFLLALLPTVGLPLQLDVPQVIDNFQIQGGLKLSPEFAAIAIGLSVYTGTFIAEVVRSGIQAVPRGQWEAAQSLGLSPQVMMGTVIFPQALRTILPPLSNQYLNLVKNSSLAVAVGYPDVYSISDSMNSQTGRPVEAMLVIIVTYLTISLTLSALINLYNRSVQIVER